MGAQPHLTTAHVDPPDSIEYLKHLPNAERFRKAASQRHLLEYLIARSIEGRAGEIKESVIAVDVFGRPPDFDSRLDNVVRVHAHRLRKLLEAYYAGEGAADPFRVSIPRGSYVPYVLRSDAAQPVELPSEPDLGTTIVLPEVLSEAVSDDRPAKHTRRSLNAFVIVLVFLAGGIVAVLALLAMGRIETRPLAGQIENALGDPLKKFWGSFLTPGTNCVVSFTNPLFLRRPTPRTSLYMTYRGPLNAPHGTQADITGNDPYVDPDLVKQGPLFFSYAWTGTGELLAAARLSKLFADARIPLKVIRSRALTYGDVRNANVIFLGSTWANELQETFRTIQTPLSCEGTVRILNHDPRPGEAASYEPELDAKNKQLLTTYVLISVLPGIEPGKKILVSAGIDTYGTGAGIDYLTTIAGVNSLLQRFNATQSRGMPEYFQAVIRTQMVRGETFNPSLVLVRELDKKTIGEQTAPKQEADLSR